MENSPNLLSTELQIDSVAYGHLKESAMWGKFLGITGFVLSGLILVAAFFAGTMLTVMPGGYGLPAGFGGIITVMYLLIAAFMFYLSLQSFRFGTKTKVALLNDDQLSLTAGLGNLKMIFRIYGILVILYLGIIVLAIVAGIIGAMFTHK